MLYFLSGKTFKEQSGGIAYFARLHGFELARRKDLLPNEEKRADEIYYKIQFKQLIEKDPPIVNASKRSISFIRTTWDRFVSAKTLLTYTAKKTILWIVFIMHCAIEVFKQPPIGLLIIEKQGYPAQVRDCE